MNHKIRYLTAAMFSVVVTLAVFYVMQLLIAGDTNRPDDLGELPTIHFADVKIPDDVEEKERKKPPPPPETTEPPPPPKMQIDQPKQVLTDVDPVWDRLDIGFGPGTFSFAGLLRGPAGDRDGDVIPLVRIAPQYPQDAAVRRIEGWVKVAFTITPAGTVSNVSVVAADPPRVFDRAAIRAIMQWKFKPRVVDGQARARRATQIIDFSIEEL